MREVAVDAMELARLEQFLEPARVERLRLFAERARERLRGTVVWNVNATAQGGGVAEMLQAILSYGRGAGVDTRWLVLDGDPEFFATTKRLHNFLHGSPGDGGELGEKERAHYEEVLEANLPALAERVRPGDIVLLHDPQPAGLVAAVRRLGAPAVWRCHIGRDERDERDEAGWEFLRGFVQDADAFIFSRRQYAPAWVPAHKLWVIPPSLDPFSTKNAELAPADVAAALQVAGLVQDSHTGGSIAFNRRSGPPGLVRSRESLVLDSGPVPRSARLVLQVSRWDRLKDMAGVLDAFCDHVDQMPPDAHLVLVGPDVRAVSDDPEGAEVLEECRERWRCAPPDVRARLHLVALPMDDADENAHLVNALQRHASVVVQKSLVEGFGLTVTEPMWKAKAVVASAVGGIRDQIEDGRNGLLLNDPTDLDAFADAVARLLHDEAECARLGGEARARVRDRFLGDRHLIQYAELFEVMLAGR
ncbi:MAG: glycosyltransferase [Nocardioidaceae bacterium]